MALTNTRTAVSRVSDGGISGAKHRTLTAVSSPNPVEAAGETKQRSAVAKGTVLESMSAAVRWLPLTPAPTSKGHCQSQPLQPRMWILTMRSP